jgi:hypothetical protein
LLDERVSGQLDGAKGTPKLLACSQVNWNYNQIFARAFELDERLVGVAFLDVGVYVTTIRNIKNFLLIGDGHRSVMFVAFQVRSSKLM